ncbi:MAG: response regulator [Candidatus Tectomicrobia bacterium]|uniref:histidine kinase n=1 Tax=Tectimicrobiota bacterium TaxID=2528274 RepID=A0A932CQ97_UNCTE|nr:response regulator [Candidatus Tectomicrobia bacterium]
MHLALVVTHDFEGILRPLRLALEEDLLFLRVEKEPEVWDLLRHKPIDLVFLDLDLGGTDPVSLLQRIREMEEDLPILALTVSSPTPELAREVREAGAYGLISSPFLPEEIRTLSQNALERRRLAQEVVALRARLLQLQASGEARSGEIPAETRGGHYPAELIRKLSKAIAHALDLDRLLSILVDLILEAFGVNKVIVFLREQDSGRYLPRASFGYDLGLLRELAFREGNPLVVWLRGYNQILKRGDLKRATLAEEVPLKQALELIEAHLVLPLDCQGSLVGFIGIGNKVAGEEFRPADLGLLFILAVYGAIAIKNALLYQEISFQKGYTQDVLDHIPSGIITVDTQGVITTFNRSAEALLGLRVREMLGKNIQKVGSVFADIFLRTIQDRRPFRWHEIVHPVTKAPLGLSTACLCDEGGVVIGGTMVFSDLSELKQLERKALELERLQFWSTLSARMAHEIKNPLVAITTFAQMLEEKYEEESFRQDFSQVVSRELNRLKDLVGQLLSFSQPRSVRQVEIEIHPLLDALLSSVQAEMGLPRVEIQRDYAAVPLRGALDGERIREALSHLLKNALEAVNAEGRLTIATREEGGFLEIDFRDNGPGVPPQDREKIFLPFYTTKSKGLGLGLPIAQRIIEDHGGKIELVPQNGKGSCFKVRLPLIKG